jgi:hypothetical protein
MLKFHKLSYFYIICNVANILHARFQGFQDVVSIFCLEALDFKNLVKFMSLQSLEILRDENFKV